MSFFEKIKEKWNAFSEKTKPARKKVRKAWRKTSRFCKTLWAYIYKLRAVILSVPVAIGAIWLACMNLSKLPDRVGINLLPNGDFSMMVAKGVAVFGPLAITAVCLLLVLCSRRTLYPWLISVFSLALPFLILITNVFPA